MNSLKTWIGLLILAACISSYIRLYPLRAHIWDPSHDQASLFVVYNIKKAILEQIHSQVPQMPLEKAEQLAQQKLNETLRKDSKKVQQTIEQVNKQIFKQSQQTPNIYLLESDPFYFYYLTENITKTGRIAEQIKGSKYFEPLMAAPYGHWQPMTYHPYIGFIIYKFSQLFNPNISLMAAVAYTPIIIMIFVLAAFFMACYSLSVSAYAAFLASLCFIMAPVILKRSSLGWYDTDPYNLFFPLLLLTILFRMVTYKNIRSLKNSIILFALVITCFASIWQGWGFMLIVSLAIVGTCGLYNFLISKNISAIRSAFFLGSCVVIATFLGISLLFGLKEFFYLLIEGFKELQKFSVKGLSLWPNLFMEVGELKRFSPHNIIEDSGGILFLLAGLFSFAYALWQIVQKSSKEYTLKIITLSVFFLICILLTIPAERFEIFALIGLFLFLAIGLNALIQRLSLFRNSWIIGGVITFLTILICINAQQKIKVSLTPIFNSAWEKALLDIKNKTPEDSIINGWWPPGHFIKAIAHRSVMFDGATLGESATGYWMANILLSTDEQHASGLLRMINLSSNKSVSFLQTKGLKTSEAVALLSNIASKTNQEAKPILQAVLNNNDDIETLLALTRGGSPHSYILLYNELVDQNLGLAFMGKWNIQRVEQLNENPSLLSSVPVRNSAAYIDFLWTLAGGPTHYSPPLALLNQDAQTMYFNENLMIDKSTMRAVVKSSVYGQGGLASTVYLNQGKISQIINPNANQNYSVVLYKKDGYETARLMDQNLANSLLIKLFFFDAAEMKYFKPLTSSKDLTGRTEIKVFEVNWNE